MRRVMLFIPTLIMVSIVAFILIQLPPGDYVTAYAATLAASGEHVDEAMLAALRKRYGLGQPIYVQYAKWMWSMLHGDFGVSFEWNKPVGEMIWSRLFLTVVISASTMLFTWIVAIPIGIYSATHQYSTGDYLATILGFIGMGIPNFMIALVLLWVGYSYFGADIGGLFSSEFQEASWSLAKVGDLLEHLWVPIIVLGMSGTAWTIRSTRANLLDELHRSYVTTARSKGLTERKLLWKYPVRVALNPFFSTVGYSLPNLISGATIISVVLSLPTTGPLLLRALMSQDMYLAGSFLMMLSLLTVVGTLMSDLILAWIDPRIRYRG
ncbi:MAG: ABC transporter permease [Chloroflexota bacterium]|nr:ABC transporter permease [Chloroflexota bacterium]